MLMMGGHKIVSMRTVHALTAVALQGNQVVKHLGHKGRRLAPSRNLAAGSCMLANRDANDLFAPSDSKQSGLDREMAFFEAGVVAKFHGFRLAGKLPKHALRQAPASTTRPWCALDLIC
jgi:hypothetical protein